MIDSILALGVIGALMYVQYRERREWAKERSQLLDRIKPETAPPPDGPIGPLLQAVPYDDDEAWAKARGLEVAS